MKYYILASLILFCMVIHHAIKRNKNIYQKQEEDFWEREQKANQVRRKSIAHLAYIQIPMDTLPLDALPDTPKMAECKEILQSLCSLPIVNLTGYSNTDLKLEYGAANITALSEYDQNYTLLVRTLQNMADALIAAGRYEESAVFMEFALSTGTDISSTYYELAKYYISRGEDSRVLQLIEAASSLRSSNKNIIANTLRESYL